MANCLDGPGTIVAVPTLCAVVMGRAGRSAGGAEDTGWLSRTLGLLTGKICRRPDHSRGTWLELTRLTWSIDSSTAPRTAARSPARDCSAPAGRTSLARR